MTKDGRSDGKKKKKKQTILTPQQLEQRKQKRDVRRLFQRVGFQRLLTVGKEFKFKKRTGELDDVFAYENVLVLAEYTVGSNSTTHILKKKVLFDLISKNVAEWIDFSSHLFPAIGEYVSNASYSHEEYQVRIAYFSKQGTSDEVAAQCEDFRFPDATTFKYFEALSKTIFRSARYGVLQVHGAGLQDDRLRRSYDRYSFDELLWLSLAGKLQQLPEEL